MIVWIPQQALRGGLLSRKRTPVSGRAPFYGEMYGEWQAQWMDAQRRMNGCVRGKYSFLHIQCHGLPFANWPDDAFLGAVIHPHPFFIGDSWRYAYRAGYSECDGSVAGCIAMDANRACRTGAPSLVASASLRGRAGAPGRPGQGGRDSRAQCPYWPQGAAAEGRAARQWRPNVIPYFFQTVPARRRRGGSALRAPCAAPPRKATGRAGWRYPPPLGWRGQICGRTRPAQ